MDLRQTEFIWLSTRTPRELIAMIRAQKTWDDTAASNLDGAVTALVGAVLARTAPDLDELGDFQALLRTARQCLPASCHGRERYVARWDSLSDCLRIRVELMIHGSYDTVGHMRHVSEILQALATAGEKGMTHDELQKSLDLQFVNINSILNALENHHIILRERFGRDKRIKLGVNAPSPDTSYLLKHTRSGNNLFAMRKAA